MLVKKLYCKTMKRAATVKRKYLYSDPDFPFGTDSDYVDLCSECGKSSGSLTHAEINWHEPEPPKVRICDFTRASDSVVCNTCNMTFDAGDEIAGCPNPDVFL
jgi:hypothetical protein